MSPALRVQGSEHWVKVLQSMGVPCAPAELSRTEQLQAMDLMLTLPGSGLNIVGLPISFDKQRPHPRADSPRLGEHNSEGFDG
jgi:crotonobetainyl-CoA:carnitine CoA-transferase CaiB-like acyl-CoA transferase